MFDELVKHDAGRHLPDLRQAGRQASCKLEGVAQSSTRVSAFMRNIAASQWLRNPELEVVETTKATCGSSFVLDARAGQPDSDGR